MSDWDGARVFVTGGAGVIGRELVGSLVDRGASVLCADLKPRPEWMDAAVEYEHGDANDLTGERVADFGPDHCFHLAATFERTEETEEFWGENYRHNVELSHNVATLARDQSTMRRMVFASSYLCYDPALYVFDSARDAPSSLAEDAPVRPRNLCGGAKLMHEKELEFLSLFSGTPFTSISARIFRVYGRGSKDIVSRWVRALTADPLAPLAAYGTEGFFDYIYAGDVAEGLLRLGASEATGVVNLGRGDGRRVAQLLDVLAACFPGAGWSEEPTDIPLEAHQADLTRLEQITGWRPPTTLERGVDIVAEYERAVRSA